MRHHFRPSGIVVSICVVPFLIVAPVPAQTSGFCRTANPQAAVTPGCEQFASVSTLLKSCNQISQITQQTAALHVDQLLTQADQTKRAQQASQFTTELTAQLALAQVSMQNAFLQSLGKVNRDKSLAQRMHDSKQEKEIKVLKISAAIIGGVGAGLGGSLRLVNNPSVQKAGTEVSIGGGVIGAAVNIWSLKPEKSTIDQARTTIVSDQETLDYICHEKPDVQFETFAAHPSQLVDLLNNMEMVVADFPTAMQAKIQPLVENLHVVVAAVPSASQ